MAIAFMQRGAVEHAPSAVFGKLPNRPDFVRFNAEHPAVRELDEVLQQILSAGAAQDGWGERYAQSARTDFYYTSSDRRWAFVGGWQASRDASGRRFPLVAGGLHPVESAGPDAHLVPIAREVFFDGLQDQLANAIENSVEALACREFLAAQANAGRLADEDVALARNLVERFLAQHVVADLEALLAGVGCSSLGQALINIAFYIDFQRRYANPALIQALVLPLPAAKGQAALAAAAWLSLLLALSGQRSWVGSYFLCCAGEASRLVVAVGGLPRRMAGLLGSEPAGADWALDLAGENALWRNHPDYAATAFALQRLLADPRQPLSVVRDVLDEVGRKLAVA